MGQKVWLIFSYFVFVSVVSGQSGRRGIVGAEDRRSPGEESFGQNPGTSSGNQWNNQQPNQQSSDFNANRRDNEYNQRQNQHFSGEHTNRETEFQQRPNQQQSSYGRDRDQNKPNQQSSGFYTKEHEAEYGQRPNQQPSNNNRETNYNTRPNQQPSNSNRETNHNTRPNQHSFESSSNNQRPNQQYSLGSSGQQTNNRESEYNQRPNQQSSNNNRETNHNTRPNQNSFESSSNNQRPNQQYSLGSSGQQTNNRESEYNQRPNQQSSNNNRETNHNTRPNQHSFESSSNNQRPNQQYSLGSSGQQTNNRESEYNQRPNQQSSNNNRETNHNTRPNQQQYGNNRDRDRNHQNQQSSGLSNNGENEYNQRPNQQQSSGNIGQSSDNQKPGGNQYAQRPPSMGSLKPEGSKPLCYGFFGCFSQSEPWTSKLRPIPAPLPPENNSAVFYFYSRPNIEQRYLISVYPEFSLGEAKFDSRRPTVIIIHGFIQDGNEDWMEDMKNAYLKKVDANAMIVDWGKGSRRLSYFQTAGNTRLIGSMISYLIKRLMESHGADPSKFHIIGHSLGAQIASYAGKEVPNIGRITALDPAQPGFEGFDKSVRLDKSDAQFVDVLHTNAKPFIPTLGLGMIKPHGHVDFYMNGGFDQPLCISPPMNAINSVKSILDLANLPINWFSQTFFCDHARAYSYFIEALNNTDCVFWGHKATLKSVTQGVANTLTQGLLAKYIALSSTCTEEDCIPVGFRTEESPLRGSFVVTTNGQFPYCRSEKGFSAQKVDNAEISKGKKI